MWIRAIVFLVLFVLTVPLQAADDADSALAVFQRRIEPILKSSKPSSCAECHLSGVNLKDYIREDQGATFLALRDAGLIDLKRPDASKLLEFIARKPEKPSVISDKVRQEEFEAFRTWIRLAVQDPSLLKAKSNTDVALKLPPVEVVRHARKDKVLQSFVDNVWSEVGRCAGCHSPDRNAERRKKHGQKVSWIKPGDPEGTFAYLLEAELIDTQDPEDSPILLKPTMQVPHGGGLKMEIGDRTYKQFMHFLSDYSAVVKAEYKTVDQLPSPRDDVSGVSDIWLKIEGVPDKFHQQLLQVDVYRWENQGWSKTPWAIGDRAVFGPKQLWQQHLTIVAPRDSKRAADILKQPKLPAGKYQIRVAVDQQGKLKKDPKAVLGPKEQVGMIEVESNWPAGYGSMTIVKFSQNP